MTLHEYLSNTNELVPRRHIWRKLYVSKPVTDEYYRNPDDMKGESLTEAYSGTSSEMMKKVITKKPGVQKTGLLAHVNFDAEEMELLNSVGFIREV